MTNISYGHGHLPADVGIQCGVERGNSVSASSNFDKNITFPTAFSETPTVLVSFNTTSVNNVMGRLALTALNATTTGFTLRIYNNSGADLLPVVGWIAVGRM